MYVKLSWTLCNDLMKVISSSIVSLRSLYPLFNGKSYTYIIKQHINV
jgi:hypothetical protein